VSKVDLNKDKLESILKKYPTLAIILQASVVSNKIVREVLDIDRWLMTDLQKDMLLNGIVIGKSSTTFQATQETLDYLKQRGK
jgi:hypothetical protein